MKKNAKYYTVTAVTASFPKGWFTVKSAEAEIKLLVQREGYGLDGAILKEKITKKDYVYFFGVKCDYTSNPNDTDLDIDASNVAAFGDLTIPARSMWIVDDQWVVNGVKK